MLQIFVSGVNGHKVQYIFVLCYHCELFIAEKEFILFFTLSNFYLHVLIKIAIEKTLFENLMW